MSISHALMRTLAERTLRLVDVYNDFHPALTELRPVLVPRAHAFIQAYDDHENYNAHHRQQLDEGKTKIAELYRLMRLWSGTLVAIIPGFSASSLLGKPSEPDVVLADAKRFIAVVEQNRELITTASELLGALHELLTAATAEWNTAQRVLAEHERLQTDVSTTKDALHVPLMSFRATLSRLLGPTHRDVLQLSLRNKRGGDDNDEADAEDATEQPDVTTITANDNDKRNVA